MNTALSEQAEITNSGGLVGAYISDSLVQLFGSGAFLFPLISLILGWACVRGKEFSHWPLRLGSGIFLLIGLCSLTAVQLDTDPIFKESIQVGGLIGETLGRFLVMWFSTVGATMFLTTMIFISLIAITGKTVNSMLESAGRFLGASGWKIITTF